VGGSWAWPGTPPADRGALWDAHKAYTQGLLWTLATDAAIPQAVRDELRTYGLCADEFVASGGWPEQLYVREGRRMVGDAVFTQADVTRQPSWGTASVGMGSYAFDAHAAQRVPCVVTPAGGCDAVEARPGESDAEVAARLRGIAAAGGTLHTLNEGYPGKNSRRYELPYSLLTPRRAECANLLAPTAPSASHVGFASLRMEPQFQILGHAAGDAAAMAVAGAAGGSSGGGGGGWDGGPAAIAVQDVPVAALQAWLHEEGAITTLKGGASGWVSE
jgi:hypothetical protein